MAFECQYYGHTTTIIWSNFGYMHYIIITTTNQSHCCCV